MSWILTDLTANGLNHLQLIGRQAVIGLLAGVVSGALVGGLGGRIAMRISAIAAGDAATGMRTENGNIVGTVTLDGTAGLVVFGGIFSGILGGLLYGAIRHVLPGTGVGNGAAYGLLTLALLGSLIIDSRNRDFALLTPAWLNVVLFALLFPLFGVVIGALGKGLDDVLPRARTVRFGWKVRLFPVIALIYAIPFLGFHGISTVTAVVVVASVLFGAGLAVLARCADSQFDVETDDRPAVAEFLYPVLAGCFLLLLLPPVSAFLTAEHPKERVLALMFLSVLASGLLLRLQGGSLARTLGCLLVAAPALVGLFFGLQSVGEILKLPFLRQFQGI